MLLLKDKQRYHLSLRNQPSYNNKCENKETKFLIVYQSQSDESVVTGDTFPSGGRRLHAI